MQGDTSLTFHGYREALASVTYGHSDAAEQPHTSVVCDDEHFVGSRVFRVRWIWLGSADLGWAYAHIWDLRFSVALAGMMGISALFLCFSSSRLTETCFHSHAQEQEQSKGGGAKHPKAVRVKRFDMGTLLLLL